MSRYGIVVVGFNRVDSLERILGSLNKAYYDENVDLIISLDNSGVDTVFNYASNFKWVYGDKTVILAEKRLGLRNHILKCGNYVNEFDFDAIILLEDDLYVSTDFFNYAKQAVAFYCEDERIAGISLYEHLWNVNADRPFLPVMSQYDTFFIQYAQSWGQVWMKRQWNAFYEWYINQEYRDIEKKKIPDNVLNWPKSSWLKYHIEYCITQNKFFVYPYVGLSTNFADAGTHYAFSTNKMQIPLMTGNKKKYSYATLNHTNAIYDAFFENLLLSEDLGVKRDDLTVDIYGMKKENYRYFLTIKKLPFKVVKSFGLKMRPQDMNVICDVEGNDIRLYDTSISEKVSNNKEDLGLVRWIYDTRGMALLKQNLIKILCFEVIQKLQSFKNRKRKKN